MFEALSLSLSLSHTQTHTHTLSLSHTILMRSPDLLKVLIVRHFTFDQITGNFEGALKLIAMPLQMLEMIQFFS